VARFLAGIVLGVVVATALGARAETVEAALVREAAVEHNVNPEWLLRVARCESSLDRYARNGIYWGLFQLGPSERARFYARGYQDVWSPADQSNYAAERFSEGAAGAWSCR
jgi:soluble lytic murein transglycosylase-like protein